MPHSLRRRESGSVLFFIFIGIALFAALSFAIAQMISTGNTDMIGEQKAALNADEIIDYGRTLRQAAQNLKIGGCDETQISFTQATGDDYEHTSEQAQCQIFNGRGGGVLPQKPTSPGLAWFFQGGTQISKVGNDGADAGELIAYMPVPSDAVCDSINKKLGLAQDINGGTLPATIPAMAKFNGSYITAGVIGVAVAPEVAKQFAACIDYAGAADPPPPSLFYQVLLAR